jgi:hypothetical protein
MKSEGSVSKGVKLHRMFTVSHVHCELAESTEHNMQAAAPLAIAPFNDVLAEHTGVTAYLNTHYR